MQGYALERFKWGPAPRMCSQTIVCNQRTTQVNLLQMWGVEVWLASAHFLEECSWQIWETTAFWWQKIVVVDQDMQAALGVTSYQGRWVLILDSVGELGPTLFLEGRLFGGAGPQTVLSYSICGGDGPHNTLSLSFVCLDAFWWEIKIRIYSVERYKNSVLERLKLQVYGESVL